MSTDVQFKIILIGDCRVGKTSYLNYIIKKGNSNKGQSQSPTIGVEYAPAKVRIRGQQMKVNLWDTCISEFMIAGAEKYKAITSSYYRKCQGAIIMFDVTDAESFRNLESWFRQIQKMTNKKFSKILIGNKLDLVESGEKPRMVTESQIIDFCQKHQVTYKCTSALSGFNIQESFTELIQSNEESQFQKLQTRDMKELKLKCTHFHQTQIIRICLIYLLKALKITKQGQMIQKYQVALDVVEI